MRFDNTKAGDEVWVTDPNHAARKHKVAKVTKKTVYIANGVRRTEAFDKENGRVKDDWGNRYVYTLEEYQAKLGESVARDELKKFGVTLEYRVGTKKAMEVYALLKPLMDKEKEAKA